MTSANDVSPAEANPAVSATDFGLWDAIPIDTVEPSAPTPVTIAPPVPRLRLYTATETPEAVSLSVEQSDVGN